MYEVLANVNAIKTIMVELDSNFQPQVEQILRASNEQSKILFLCSPNNPSGNSFNQNNVEALIRNFQGLVVLDEAYIDFSEQESWINRLEEFPNLVVTQTLSKAYGMAGIRLGICYASEDIISTLNKIKPPYNVNELTQQRALEQLNNPDVVNHQVSAILNERTVLIEALKTVKFVSKIYSTDANFILIKVDDASKRYNQLIEKGIVVRNRTNQPLCENCLRLTIGTASENKKLIESLIDLLGF
jgi:histidinol-phosphate aminotransferase